MHTCAVCCSNWRNSVRCCWHRFVSPEILSPFDVLEYQLFRYLLWFFWHFHSPVLPFLRVCFRYLGFVLELVSLLSCSGLVLTDFVTCWLGCTLYFMCYWSGFSWLSNVGAKGDLVTESWQGFNCIAGFPLVLFGYRYLGAEQVLLVVPRILGVPGERVKPPNTKTCKSIYFL